MASVPDGKRRSTGDEERIGNSSVGWQPLGYSNSKRTRDRVKKTVSKNTPKIKRRVTRARKRETSLKYSTVNG